MNDLTGKRIGFVVTGSFCTFSAAFAQAKRLRDSGAVLTPIFSEHAASMDTRFGTAAVRVAELEEICGKKALRTIAEVEPLGPKSMLDVLAVAPCTANTAAKLAHSITDTTATMAVKSMLRRQKPVVLALATNDALRGSAKNIGLLMNTTIISCPCGRMRRRRNPPPWWRISNSCRKPCPLRWTENKFSLCFSRRHKPLTTLWYTKKQVEIDSSVSTCL